MAAAAGARKALADECPNTCIGALLAMLLQQVGFAYLPALYCRLRCRLLKL